MTEIFKPIIGYEGLYEISNLGRVRSLDRVIVDKKGVHQHFKGQFITPFLTKGGYYEVMLSKNKVRRVFLLHRLVATHFLGECPEGCEVDHINRDKTDNRLENLRYVSHVENCVNRNNNRDHLKKKVLQYTLDGCFVREYPSMEEAANAVGGFKSNVWACCRGKAKSAYGYLWRYA